MRRLICVVVLAGCYNPAAFQPCNTACQNDQGCPSGFSCGGDGLCRGSSSLDCSANDAAVDDGITPDLPPGTICLGKGFIKNVCFAPGAMPVADLGGAVQFDTLSDCTMVINQAGQPPICALVGRRFTLAVGQTMRVTGPRPLAIITTMGMMIEGTIDVSSRPAEHGAGAAPPGVLCSLASAGKPAIAQGDGGGGGAGGALTTEGGNGGSGAGGHQGGGTTAPTTVSAVRGGCDGGPGGNNTQGAGGGVAGLGGGAVYLLTGETLTISGNINASGSGGGAPANQGGGGGGGSGGFIGLDASAFAIAPSARLFASGGSGASGGGMTTIGQPGGIATPSSDPPLTTGQGGGGSSGAGSSMTGGGAGATTTGGGGGGGGGGGAGYIGYAGPYSSISPTVRPAAVQMP